MRRSAAMAALLGLAALTAMIRADDVSWRARLATAPIDPTLAATVTGRGEARADLDGTKLTIRGTFSGLNGPATGARLHAGRRTGVRGAAFAKLGVTRAAQGELSGTLELTSEQLAALRAGRVYVQIDSEPAPDGNLWGWLLAEE